MTASVMVGFDGSQHSQVAVNWAAQEAQLRRRPLVIVHAFLVLGPLPPESAQAHTRALRAVVGDLVEAEVERVRELAPGIDVSGRIVSGITASVELIEASRDAELLVVGSRGRGAFTELLLGSTASQVAAHALCPAVVVRGPATGDTADPDRVVVGVDGSPLAQAALRFGFEEASLRGARLIAVHAWKHPVSTEPGDMLPLVYDIDALAADEERLLAESLAGWQSKYPDVPVERVCERSDVRRLLKEKSAGARLLVLGSRGHGGFTGLLMGSTTQAMVHHAEAPVAIVHPSTQR
ncbi:universal stress protein [Stackebrandtia nassauensis]|uniref:UspA domain protein n=1 Tax=Stackebrandtia nassauensis (strain DSM 44728 / CIP 108903 / NRRL B-16338 / NBRC 102104 / LLR-40K-21) TaxID=446470 RepID=D3PXI7_STANL|nr:universal stress protein [Stackebrandtia nassauensis]ADD43317.1 UspA domain protein [Stackebrandtia nassauensis DSM 44728]